MSPLPAFSETLCLRLARADVALFRFLLEGWDGLTLFTSLGADAAGNEILLLRFAPEAEPGVRRFLDAALAEFPLEPLPAAHPGRVAATQGGRP